MMVNMIIDVVVINVMVIMIIDVVMINDSKCDHCSGDQCDSKYDN